MDMSRKKKMVSFALDPEILAKLDAWLAKQEFPPSKTAVVEAALKAFLELRDGKD
jgi:predicted transcriptional regulator